MNKLISMTVNKTPNQNNIPRKKYAKNKSREYLNLVLFIISIAILEIKIELFSSYIVG